MKTMNTNGELNTLDKENLEVVRIYLSLKVIDTDKQRTFENFEK